MTRNIRKELLKQLSPSAGFWQKFQRKWQMYITLNMNDLQCRHFFFNPSQKKVELRRHANGPHNRTIHPFSKLNRFFLRVLFLLLIHKVIFLPYSKLSSPILLISSVIRDIIQFLLIICSFFTGYADWEKEEVILEPKTVVKHYLSTYFSVDVLLVALEYVYFAEMPLYSFILDLTGICAIIVRFRSIFHVLTETLMYLDLSSTASFIIENLSILAFIVQIMACFIYWIPFHVYEFYQEFPQNSWIIKHGFSFWEYNTTTHIRSYLFVSSYFLGSNYFDVVVQPVEQLLLFIFTFTGRLYTMVVIARVLVFFGFSDASESDYENLMYQMNNYMSSMDIPEKIQNIIKERVDYSYQRKYFREREISGIFTERIQAELFLHSARNLIKKNILFNKLNSYTLAKLFSNMKSNIYSRDDIVQDYGGRDPHIYFINYGSCAGLTTEGMQFTHVEDGDCFGCIRLNTSISLLYQARYVALETTEIYYVHHKMLRWSFGQRFKFFYYFNKLRADRLKSYRTCKAYSTRSKTFLGQLGTGRILEKPKLKLRDNE